MSTSRLKVSGTQKEALGKQERTKFFVEKNLMHGMHQVERTMKWRDSLRVQSF